jgi:hypothetical protein
MFLVADIMSKMGPNAGLKYHLPFYVQEGHDGPSGKIPAQEHSARAGSSAFGTELSVDQSAIVDEFFKQKQA